MLKVYFSREMRGARCRYDAHIMTYTSLVTPKDTFTVAISSMEDIYERLSSNQVARQA